MVSYDGKEAKESGVLSIPSRSKRPYLIRAMHEWMADNGHTPHIVVDAAVDGVNVPREHVKDGRIILNISESAAHNLKLTNTAVSFRARFSGVPYDVWVPMKSVLGIYARETGQGMIFSHDAEAVATPVADDPEESRPRRPHLTLVK
ncbi:MAG: ClpXP protease specificity-enhancing factor [Woeseiaceae bacterium]